ncbi:MAG: hypothetical protein ACTSRE_12865 [Promethearchaeota archaeon]
MNNFSIVVDDWIRALRTMDPMRSQIRIENIHENFQLFNPNDKRNLLLTFLQNIQMENSEIFIKNYIACLTTLNKSSIVSSLELLQNTINPVISKQLLESSINRSIQSHEKISALITHCMSEPFSALFAYTISLITENSLTEYIPTLKKFYREQTTILIEHFKGMYELQNSEYVILLENVECILVSLDHFKISEVLDNYKHILSNLCTENIYSLYDPTKLKLSSLISQLFYNIAILGSDPSYLLRQFKFESSERVKIAIIHKLSEIGENIDSQPIISLLKDIGQDDNYFAFAVASLVKIGGDTVKNYILDEINSKKYRRVFFTTYFLPYLDFPDEIYDEVIRNLFKYKQPLILKQALWVVRKKKLCGYVIQATKLLFHDNDQVRNEAQKVLLESPNSIDHLTKTMNYYGPEKQEVISHLISKLRKLNL